MASTLYLIVALVTFTIASYFVVCLITAALTQERRLARFRAEWQWICNRAAAKLRQMEALNLSPERYRKREIMVEEWLHEQIGATWDNYIRIFRFPRICR